MKYQIGSTTINLDPYGEIEINLNEIEHVKKAVMRRALALLPTLHPERLEVIELEAPDKDIFRIEREEEAKEEEN